MIKVLVGVTNPSSSLSAPTFSFFIYGDIAKTQENLQGDYSPTSPSPYIQSYPAFSQAQMVHYEAGYENIYSGGASPLVFDLVFSGTL